MTFELKNRQRARVKRALTPQVKRAYFSRVHFFLPNIVCVHVNMQRPYRHGVYNSGSDIAKWLQGYSCYSIEDIIIRPPKVV